MKSNLLISVLSSAAVLTMLLLPACGETEHTEAVTAEITAAQMEGRSAARIFVNHEWKDSTKLQHHLLEAKARQSKYLIDGKPECAAAFDSAFISTIRAVRPDLAASISK